MAAPLVGPDGQVLNTPLANCYRVYDPEGLRVATGRTWSQTAYKQHPFKIIAVTSKGAGGTGKTTTAWSLAEGLARAGQRVLLLNTDSQPSVEERLLGKLVHMSFGGDYDLFYELNGLERQQTLRGGLFALRNFEPPGVGQVPTPVPRRAVEVDVERVASPNHQQGGAGRVLLVRSDEDISDWETELGSAWRRHVASMPDPPAQLARTYGAFYHFCQMQAYMMDCSFVIVDTGPGSGPLLMNVVMSSHAFCIAAGIDQKAKSTIRSMAESFVKWTDMNQRQSHFRIRQEVNEPVRLSDEISDTQEVRENRYPVQTHVPLFLGLVYSRLGKRGRALPYNQYSALADANHTLTTTLMPVLAARNMLLPQAAYQAAKDAIPQVFDAPDDDVDGPPPGVIRVPQPPLGVAAMLLEFNQLQHISERESIPVFFVPNGVMRTPDRNALRGLLDAVEAGLPPPVSVYSPHLYKACSPGECARMAAKVTNLRHMLANLQALVAAL